MKRKTRAQLVEELHSLEWRVVHNARHTTYPRPRWALVMQATGFGSTRAHALCVKHGVDPNEMIEPVVED